MVDSTLRLQGDSVAEAISGLERHVMIVGAS